MCVSTYFNFWRLLRSSSRGFRRCFSLFQLHQNAPAQAEKGNRLVGMQSYERVRTRCGGKDDTKWKIQEKKSCLHFQQCDGNRGRLKEKEFEKSAATKRNAYDVARMRLPASACILIRFDWFVISLFAVLAAATADWIRFALLFHSLFHFTYLYFRV